MKTPDVLRRQVAALNNKDYGAYQSLKGMYSYPQFSLSIDRIPKDPYAPPHTGVYRATVKNTFSSQFDVIFNSKTSEIAFRDFLARSFHAAAQDISKGRRGTGNSGQPAESCHV